jgi:uncharacterized membrane protein (DUF485 family)
MLSKKNEITGGIDNYNVKFDKNKFDIDKVNKNIKENKVLTNHLLNLATKYSVVYGDDSVIVNMEDLSSDMVELNDYNKSLMNNLHSDISYSNLQYNYKKNRLRNQKHIGDVVKDYKNVTKKRYNDYLQDIHNKQKNVEINTYHIKKYRKQKHLLYIILIICLIIVFVSYLKNRYDSYFDDYAYSSIIGIILGISFIIILYVLWDIYLRDNVNFDEYDPIFYKFDYDIDANNGEGSESCSIKPHTSFNDKYFWNNLFG